MRDVVDGDFERLDFAEAFVAVGVGNEFAQTSKAEVDCLHSTSLTRVAAKHNHPVTFKMSRSRELKVTRTDRFATT